MLDTPTCDALGVSDFIQFCASTPTLMALGPHTARIRVVDHAGRVTWSLLQPFRVALDGDPPELTINNSPPRPTPGSTFTLTATATDPAGISQIIVGPVLGGTPQICNFGGASMTETCALSVTAPPRVSVMRYYASAVDTESLTSIKTRIALIGDGGGDADGDGLGLYHEAELCTSDLNPDTDGDALPDGWEVVGVLDETGTGLLLDLPALGANPCFKDVFLHFDYEEGANVEAGVFDDIIQAFRDHAVNLHVDANERPRLGGLEHTLLGSREAPYQTAGNGGEYWFPPERLWTHYYGFSGHSIGWGAGGEGSFTYSIYIGDKGTCSGGTNDGNECKRDSECPDGGTCTNVCRCPLGVDPNTCRDGTYDCRRESADWQARRLMHELGHAVGLGHGGRTDPFRTYTWAGDYFYYGPGGSADAGVNTNRKPNYHSLMNYSVNGSDQCWVPTGGLVMTLDYSASASLGTLVETGMNEGTSLLTSNLPSRSCDAAVPGSIPVAVYTCMDPDDTGIGNDSGLRYLMVTDGTSTIARQPMMGSWDFSPPSHSPGVDFNCDGSINPGISGNINGDGLFYGLPVDVCDGDDDELGCDWSDASETISDHDDWAVIPSPPVCRIAYDTGRDCYPWPAAYRAGAGSHAPDCRPSGSPVDICSYSETYASGQILWPEPFEALRDPPGTEICDGWDNDRDGTIDEGCRDTDSDGTTDRVDNCPATPNFDQADGDRDQLGDACDDPGSVTPTFDYTGADGSGLSWTPRIDVLGYNVYCEFPDRGGQPAHVGDRRQLPRTPRRRQLRQVRLSRRGRQPAR